MSQSNKENQPPNFKAHPKAPEIPGTDKERLYKKLWEENSLLKEMQVKKRSQVAQLRERMARLTEGIEQANDVIRLKGSELIRLKGAVEEAQRKNVEWTDSGRHDRRSL